MADRHAVLYSSFLYILVPMAANYDERSQCTNQSSADLHRYRAHHHLAARYLHRRS